MTGMLYPYATGLALVGLAMWFMARILTEEGTHSKLIGRIAVGLVVLGTLHMLPLLLALWIGAVL